MSMRVVEDRFGDILRLEPTGHHAWRRWLGRYLFASVIAVAVVLATFLIRDPEISLLTKIALVGFGCLVAIMAAIIIEHLLRPRSGVVDLRFDRSQSEVKLVPHSVLRSARTVVAPTADITEIRLRATGLPAFSLGGILAAARSASHNAELDEPSAGQQLFAVTPLELRLSFVSDDGSQRRVRESTLAVQGVVEDVDAVVLASRIAAACGFEHQSVYTMPKTGVDIHLTRQPTTVSEPVPQKADQLFSAAERGLAAAGAPPFEVSRLEADHRVIEWSPGRLVQFERTPPKARFLAVPFTLLALLGPALWFYAVTYDREINPLGFGVLSGLGLVVGLVAIIVVRIPARRIEFDWNHRVLLLTRRSKCTTVSFDSLRRLELEGIAHESSSGDSGSTSMSYWCKLKVIPAGDTGDSAKPIDLLSTRSTHRPDEPWRQASPLLVELADALGIEGRTTGYGR